MSGIGVDRNCCWIRCRVSKLKKKKERRKQKEGRVKVLPQVGRLGLRSAGGVGGESVWLGVGGRYAQRAFRSAAQVQSRPPHTGPGVQGRGKGWSPSWGLHHLSGIDSQGQDEEEQELSQGSSIGQPGREQAEDQEESREHCVQKISAFSLLLSRASWAPDLCTSE